MKVKITISTDDGRSYEGEAELTQVPGTPKKRAASKKNTAAATSPKPAARSSKGASPSTKFDFTLPLRAFVTASNARKLSGPQKFTLLLAALTKGDTSTTVDNNRIEKEWNKMTAPMGGKFNRAYSTRAKEKGWIDSPKQGVYKLRSTWTAAVP